MIMIMIMIARKFHPDQKAPPSRNPYVYTSLSLSIYIYIYTHMYTHLSLSIYLSLSLYIYIYIYTHLSLNYCYHLRSPRSRTDWGRLGPQRRSLSTNISHVSYIHTCLSRYRGDAFPGKFSPWYFLVRNILPQTFTVDSSV